MCLAHGLSTNDATSVTDCPSERASAWYSTVAAFPVVLMSATVPTPAVVHDKGLHIHSAFVHQLRADVVNGIQGFRLGHSALRTADIEIIPGFIIQEFPVRKL